MSQLREAGRHLLLKVPRAAVGGGGRPGIRCVLHRQETEEQASAKSALNKGCKMAQGARLGPRVSRHGAGSGHLWPQFTNPHQLSLAGVKQQLEMVRPSLSMISVFICLRGTKKDLGLQTTNYYVYFDTDMDKA